MKSFILSTSLALGLGALALSPASAGPISKTTIVAPAVTSDVACRTVERRVRNGGTVRITRSQVCDSPRRTVERRVYRDDRRVYRDRRDYRRDYRRNDAPGFSIRVNP